MTTTEAPSGNSSEQNDTQISSSTSPASGVRRLGPKMSDKVELFLRVTKSFLPALPRRLRGSLHALFDLPLSAAFKQGYNTAVVVLCIWAIAFSVELSV